MDVVLMAVAFAVLGLMVGYGVGLARAIPVNRRRRATAGAAAGFAAAGLTELPKRSAEAILGGYVRVFLGGVPYDLPVLSRIENRRWIATLDQRFAELATALDDAANDVGRILTLLTGHTDWCLEVLIAYDQHNLLPDREYLDEFATDAEILRATLEVWRAANPLAAILVAAADGETDGTRSGSSSTSSTPTDGIPETSTTSPTSS